MDSMSAEVGTADCPGVVIFDLDETLIDSGRPEKVALEEAINGVLKPSDRTLAPRLADKIMDVARIKWEESKFYALAKGDENAIGISAHEVLWGNPLDGVDESSIEAAALDYFKQLQAFLPNWREGVWKEACRDLNVTLKGWDLQEMMSDFISKRKAKLRLFDGVQDAIIALKTKGLKLALLTNGAPGIQREKIRVALAAILEEFDAIVVSGEFGRGKPCFEIFDHVLDRLGSESRSGFIVMVGDGRPDMQGARNYNAAHSLRSDDPAFMHSVWICPSWEQTVPPEWRVAPNHTLAEARDLLAWLESHFGLS